MSENTPIAISANAWAGIRAALVEKDRLAAEQQRRLRERRERDAERKALIAERTTPELPTVGGATPMHVITGWAIG